MLLGLWRNGLCRAVMVLKLTISPKSSSTTSLDFGKVPRMIVVSNRLPFVFEKKPDGTAFRKPSAGGLVTAVGPVVVGTNGVWVGWPGRQYKRGDSLPESDPQDQTPCAGLKSNKIVPIYFEKDLLDEFYFGACNNMFWPLMHSMPDKTLFTKKSWDVYKFCNSAFADATMEAVHKSQDRMVKGKHKNPDSTDDLGTLVWLHDYHLTLTPSLFRSRIQRRINEIKAATYSPKETIQKLRQLKTKISFFLHTPFPSWEMFRIFPWAPEVLEGLLGCDIIGFHTPQYCNNFLSSCKQMLGSRVDFEQGLIEYGGRSVKVCSLPIGIPYDKFESLAQTAPKFVQENTKVILGVDRLDYTKGLPERIRGFEILLEVHPELREKVSMLQIAVPSRTSLETYRQLKEELDQLVGRVNGRFATAKWSPIHYIFGMVSQHDLAGIYRDSYIGLVTPLRDGMNLVAKEYVACQINKTPGVLVLSPFAGAGGLMKEAISCNPYEYKNIADALYRALHMSPQERTIRMNQLRRREKRNDIKFWVRQLFVELESLHDNEEGSYESFNPINFKSFDDLFDRHSISLEKTEKLGVFISYDGAIAPPSDSSYVFPDPNPETHDLVSRLSMHPNARICITSHRNPLEVKEKMGHVNADYIGFHGMEILFTDKTRYSYNIPKTTKESAQALYKKLLDYGSKNKAAVFLHGVNLRYEFPPHTSPQVRRPQMEAVAKVASTMGFTSIRNPHYLELVPPLNWTEGNACVEVMVKNFGLDFLDRVVIVFIGFDEMDELAMDSINGLAICFRVVPRIIFKSVSHMRLPNTQAVTMLLRYLTWNFQRKRQFKPKKGA